ncbi:MAG: hypothetical protein KBG75_00625 [Pseudomonadales bacterium]|nr:hypothetical protein [Pseudomonadales bacterium]
MTAPAPNATHKITAWLEANLGGDVQRISRQSRWRPVWFADMERNGETLALCVRGERTDMPMIFPLDHEMRFQSLLQERNIPVARVHGWIDDPRAYVMDRVPGSEDFSATPQEERQAVVDDYLQILARIHQLPIEPFISAGIRRADEPGQSGRVGLQRYEEIYRSRKRNPEPFMEFCLGWLHRHWPDTRGREAPVLWDSGQFHHADGRIVAALDLELGHIGDPMMDLAGWRIRDTVIGYGNFTDLYARYAELSDRPVDLDAIRIYYFAFTLTNHLALGAALRDPAPESDLMINLRWCSETDLFATEALAEILGIELPVVDVPLAQPSTAARSHAHLVHSLRQLKTDDEYLNHQVHVAFRLARHLQRHDEIGAALASADLDDLQVLLGTRPANWEEGEEALERFVLTDAKVGAYDRVLVPLFYRRNRRAQLLLGPEGTAMTRHFPAQRFNS